MFYITFEQSKLKYKTLDFVFKVLHGYFTYFQCEECVPFAPCLFTFKAFLSVQYILKNIDFICGEVCKAGRWRTLRWHKHLATTSTHAMLGKLQQHKHNILPNKAYMSTLSKLNQIIGINLK